MRRNYSPALDPDLHENINIETFDRFADLKAAVLKDAREHSSKCPQCNQPWNGEYREPILYGEHICKQDPCFCAKTICSKCGQKTS